MNWLQIKRVVYAVGSVAAQVIGLVLSFRVIQSHGSLLEMGSALGWLAASHVLKGTGEAR